MEAAVGAVVVALITGPLMFMLKRLDKRNTEQHGQSMGMLKEVQENVRDMKGDVRDVKQDMRDLRGDHQRLSGRVDRLTKDVQQHIGGD